jgi:hypothetical protein
MTALRHFNRKAKGSPPRGCLFAFDTRLPKIGLGLSVDRNVIERIDRAVVQPDFVMAMRRG